MATPNLQRPPEAASDAELLPTNQDGAPIIGEYQGKPLLILNPSSRFPFQIGLSKCKKILANIDVIRAFVESNGRSIEGAVGEEDV